jgi:hypothetical protein
MWRDPLDSGEAPSGLMDIIRETARRRDAYVRARTSLNKKFTKPKRHCAEYKVQLEAKFETVLEESTPDYFPDYWLTFALFGPPAPTSKQMQIFKIQNIADLQEKIVKVGGKRMNRNSRSTLQGKNKKPPPHNSGSSPLTLGLSSDSPLTTTSSKKGGSSQVKTVNVTHTIHVPSRNEQSAEVLTEEGILEKIITTLKNAGKLADGTYQLQAKITKYSEELADLMIRKLTTFDDVVQEGDDWMMVE